ncbi:MAG: CotH kinase family protein [Bacteroidota bacterium]
MIKYWLRVLLFLFLGSSTVAQNINPAEDEIFRPDEIAELHITMTSVDSAFLFAEENVLSEDYLPVQFRFVNSLMDSLLAFDVGIRLRGNTSRYHPKKSLKIKFKEYGGEKFYNHKSFNLKAENNDPSFVREMLSLKLFRDANVAAARTHHTKVFLNGVYMGLYLNVEQIDDEFTDTRYGEEDGNLYKCHYGASLESDNDIYDNVIFELETNKTANDRSRLEQFIQDLNLKQGGSFETLINETFEIDRFLKYLAVEALTGHWDGYSYNQNNFYLYENTQSGKIEFIPYDVDNTFGIDWIPDDWANRDVLNWAIEDEERPLVKKILSRPVYFNRYAYELKMLLNSYFTEEQLYPQFDFYQDLLAEAVEEDNYFPRTFGFDLDDFQNSYSTSLGGHLPYGLKPYVSERVASAREQVSTVVTSLGRPVSGFKFYPNPNDGRFLFLTSGKPGTISIRDIQGRDYAFSLITSGNIIKLEYNLPVGLYLLQNGTNISKLVVN